MTIPTKSVSVVNILSLHKSITGPCDRLFLKMDDTNNVQHLKDLIVFLLFYIFFKDISRPPGLGERTARTAIIQSAETPDFDQVATVFSGTLKLVS